MKKRESRSKKSSATSSREIRGRIRIRKKWGLPIKILIFLMMIAVLAFSYMKLGKLITIALGVLLFGISILVFIFTRKGKLRKRLIHLLIIFILSLGIITLLGFTAFVFYVKSQAEPKYKEALLNTLEVSIIYANDGSEIAKLGTEKREKVTYDELPEVLVDAIIATEDSRFFKHNGLDAPRFIMATINQLLRKSGAGGASTLSMQVVKNSFTDKFGQFTSGKAGIIRKFEDIYLAVFRLEKDFSKEEIIEFYVNNHFLGGNIYGVEEAANVYFGKNVSDLNLSEAAIIAGMFKSPNEYKPTTHPEDAAKRRKTVLYLMRRAGYITEEEEKVANSIPVESLTVNSNSLDSNPYQGFIDTVFEELEDKYNIDIYTTPLRIWTTLDKNRQIAVNSVLNGETYEWINDRVQTGVAVIESETGAVLAVGNGRNVNGRSSSDSRLLNYATQIRRQPGSTAKPLFDYGPGIEYNDWSTYYLFDDSPYHYTGGRSIKNWDGGYFGVITLRRALSTSRNIPALKAFQAVDNNKIKEFVTSLGITPELCNTGYKYDRENNRCVNKKDSADTQDTIGLHEAHAIGAFTGVSPMEMAGAYAAFSNGGYYNEPYTITKFEYRQTGVTVEHQPNRKQVMSDATAYMISSVLQDVALTGGTPNNVACKTGTTNFDEKTMDDYDMPWDAIRDSWVIGYSTKTTIGMWYGYDNFTMESIAEGYVLHNVPATIQKDRLFNALVASGAMEGNRSAFTQPSSVSRVSIAVGSNPGKLAPPGVQAVSELYKKGTEPTDYDFSNYKLSAPNLSASYDSATGKVTLSWNAVSPGALGNESHGKFGYNVYKNNVLVAWTDKTSYTFSAKDGGYATYKIIGTYKSYNDIQTEAAIITVAPDPNKDKNKEKEKEKEKETVVEEEEPLTPEDKPTT